MFYPAWHALPHLRPIVFGLMARLEAVQLGGVLITRVPAGKAGLRRMMTVADGTPSSSAMQGVSSARQQRWLPQHMRRRSG